MKRKTPIAATVCWILAGQSPQTDRVGYPENYRETFVRVRVSDRADSKTTAVIYANLAGAAVHPGEPGPYPYGSVLIDENWTTVKDASGNVVLDANGRYKLDQPTKVHVMRKERGFGEGYGENRSGEWEFVSYEPGGKGYATPPEKAGIDCARCHRLFATSKRDWVFGRYEKH